VLCFIDDRLVSTSAHKKEETRERDKERINRIGRDDDDHRGIQFDSNPKTQQQTLVVVYVVVVVVVVKKKAREEENKGKDKEKRNRAPLLSRWMRRTPLFIYVKINQTRNR